MKYNQRDYLLREEEAYKNNLYPTEKPKSSKEIKLQLNNSFRSAYSNISKNNITNSNFFQESNIGIQTSKKINNNNNNLKKLDILPDINYTNKIINQNDNNNIINEKSSNIELIYCLGIISNLKNCFCFHPIEKFFIYISTCYIDSSVSFFSPAATVQTVLSVCTCTCYKQGWSVQLWM